MRAAGFVLFCAAAFSQQQVNVAPVTELHVMAPMRDGTKLSIYLFLPPGKGPWPVLYEQRYSNVTVPSSRGNYAALAMKGYVVAAENFRGAQQSEGVYTGYRALGWGNSRTAMTPSSGLPGSPGRTGKSEHSAARKRATRRTFWP